MNHEPLGFIGLGIMGRPMAEHLLRAGHPLCVFSRTRAAAQPLLQAGAVWCDSPAAVARQTRLLFTMVTDTADVRQVLLGEPDGAARGLAAGSIVVDFSTIDPRATRDVAGELMARGVTLLDAPVTGGEIGAREATLTIMVGGPEQALSRVRPVLERLGKKIVHMGPSGSGQTLKAANQVLCAVNMIGVSEALRLLKASGIDLPLAIETLERGAGGSWAWAHLGRKIVAGDWKPAFMVKLIQKDLRIVQGLAEELELSPPATAEVANVLHNRPPATAEAGCGGHERLPGVALARRLFAAVEELPDGAKLGTQAMMRAYERAGP
jgi:3-hydroxyisobutyrate dehydrogenase